MPNFTKPFDQDAADVRQHYVYANNGLSCPDPDNCPVCIKKAADAHGHTPGTTVVSLDRPKEQPWQPQQF